VNSRSTAQIASQRQTYWDWRSAGNFILGGSGAGVLIYSAAGFGGRLLELLGAVLIAGGLLGVWSEIGRPWRHWPQCGSTSHGCVGSRPHWLSYTFTARPAC